MINFTVDSVKYGRSSVELELSEDLTHDRPFARVRATNGISLSLRFGKDDPLYSTVIEKATIGATMTLDFAAPQDEPQA